MSEDSSNEEIKTITDIKKEKKEKKELSSEVKLIRASNAKKALEAKMIKFNERQQIKTVDKEINNIFNNNDDDNEEEPLIIIKNKKKKEKDNNNEISNNNNNDILTILNKMSNRVDKLYTMKKFKNNQPKKEIQPVIINDNNKSTSLLESIRNKMINQY